MAFAQQPPAQPPRQAPSRAAAGVTQQRAPQTRGAMRRAAAGGPNMPMGRGPVGMLLGMTSQLELTDDQVKKLESLRNAPHPKPNQSDMLRARADMMDATQGDGDLTKARAALDRMSKLRTDEQIARLKERQDVRAVLTAAQKTKLDNMRGAMRGQVRQVRQMRKMRHMRQGRAARMMRQGGGPGMGGGMRLWQRGPGMGPGGMRPERMGPDGMRSGGMSGGMGPGMRGNMAPGGMRPARPPMEENVVIERRRPAQPVPPVDSLNRP